MKAKLWSLLRPMIGDSRDAPNEDSEDWVVKVSKWFCTRCWYAVVGLEEIAMFVGMCDGSGGLQSECRTKKQVGNGDTIPSHLLDD